MSGLPCPAVTLRVLDPADAADVAAVVGTAVAGALPREVMPPDDAPDPDEWTVARERAYARFLRSRPGSETSYLVVEGAVVVGVARLLHAAAGAESGVWLVGSARGRGMGTAVLGLLVERAAATGAALREQADTVAAVVELRGLRARGSSR